MPHDLQLDPEKIRVEVTRMAREMGVKPAARALKISSPALLRVMADANPHRSTLIACAVGLGLPLHANP